MSSGRPCEKSVRPQTLTTTELTKRQTVYVVAPVYLGGRVAYMHKHIQRDVFADALLLGISPSLGVRSTTKFSYPLPHLHPSRLSTSSILHVMLKLMQFEALGLETEGVTMSTKTEPRRAPCRVATRRAGVTFHLLLSLLFSVPYICLRCKKGGQMSGRLKHLRLNKYINSIGIKNKLFIRRNHTLCSQE